MNQIEFYMIFSQIINDLFHADLTNLTKTRIVSLACTSGMQTFDEVDKHGRKRRALCEIREICLRIKCLCKSIC